MLSDADTPYVYCELTDAEAGNLLRRSTMADTIVQLAENMEETAIRNSADNGWQLLTTRNPNGHWDWFRVGNQSSGSFPGCDSNQVRVGDLGDVSDKVRENEIAAAELYDKMVENTRGLPQPHLWRDIYDGKPLNLGSAIDEYDSQPWVQRARQVVHGIPVTSMMDCFFHVGTGGKTAFMTAQGGIEVPDAYVTTDGDWVAYSDFDTRFASKAEYVAAYRHYRDTVDARTWINDIDVHS